MTLNQRDARPSAAGAEGGSPLMHPSGGAARRRTGLIPACVLFLVAALIGLFAPDATQGDSSMAGMAMTHYMGLLSVNQPWNLLLFMAVPVVLAETLAITELVILFPGRAPGWVHLLNRWAGLLAGPVMLGILLHLVQYAVIPLTEKDGWAGWADVVAVLSYLAGAVPLIIVTLVQAGLYGETDRGARRIIVACVAAFLVVAHIAMILGMLDPTVTGWRPPAAPSHGPTHQMPDGSIMPGHTH